MEDIQEKVEELDETPKPLTEDEVRKEVIENYSLEEDENSELIDKLVTDKIEGNKKFSVAIKQKRTWREKAEGLEKEKPEPKTEDPKPTITEDDKSSKDEIIEVLEQRDLENLDLSDELKKKVSSYAKIEGMSIKKALESEYVKFHVEQDEKTKKTDDASLGSTSRKGTKNDYSEKDATDYDMTTKQGREDHAKHQEYLKENL